MLKIIKRFFESKWIEVHRNENPHFDVLMSGYVWLIRERHQKTGLERSRYTKS